MSEAESIALYSRDRQFFRNELTDIRTEIARIGEYLFGQREEP